MLEAKLALYRIIIDALTKCVEVAIKKLEPVAKETVDGLETIRYMQAELKMVETLLDPPKPQEPYGKKDEDTTRLVLV